MRSYVRIQIMNRFLTKTWWLFGAISVLTMLGCSRIGWYALANAAVIGAGVWTVHLAALRQKRWLEAKQTVKKMTKKQQKALTSMDTREVKNIQSLAKMMPYLCFGVLLLDGYTFYYNQTKGTSFALFGMDLPFGVNVALLVIGLVAGVAYYYTWCVKMNSMMDLH